MGETTPKKRPSSVVPMAPAATEQPPQGWEYIDIGGSSSERLMASLNSAGANGWEAVTVDLFQCVAVLKRRLP